MKTLADYIAEYESIPKKNEATYTIKKEVYIFAKWEEENKITPWDNQYTTAYKNLKLLQPDLYDIVCKGREIFMQSLPHPPKLEKE